MSIMVDYQWEWDEKGPDNSHGDNLRVQKYNNYMGSEKKGPLVRSSNLIFVSMLK